MRANAEAYHPVTQDRGSPLLQVKDLAVRFPTRSRPVEAVKSLSLDLRRGRC